MEEAASKEQVDKSNKRQQILTTDIPQKAALCSNRMTFLFKPTKLNYSKRFKKRKIGVNDTRLSHLPKVCLKSPSGYTVI
jgi:hypothetical protein